ncbi:Hypothetical protein GbCGDNIH3_5096 [Granulibacter bethesdensis]|uniref:Uncharacterized protein n=1 Tax=Granulibacter bethesdensis TaxID=364410 RepID=A0AAN0RDG9_9PROT|nr:Hypothetical protein GbCGDNIH3_5096 [Granulibacter bethesdensis]
MLPLLVPSEPLAYNPVTLGCQPEQGNRRYDIAELTGDGGLNRLTSMNDSDTDVLVFSSQTSCPGMDQPFQGDTGLLQTFTTGDFRRNGSYRQEFRS